MDEVLTLLRAVRHLLQREHAREGMPEDHEGEHLSAVNAALAVVEPASESAPVAAFEPDPAPFVTGDEHAADHA